MGAFWKAVIVLICVVAAAESLTCHLCPIGIFGHCLFGGSVTCNNFTESCFRGVAKFNATSALGLRTRGCLDSDLCGKTITGQILTAGYTARFTCCTTDMCNSAATSLQVSVTFALGAALLSALWGSPWE